MCDKVKNIWGNVGIIKNIYYYNIIKFNVKNTGNKY